MLPFFLLGNWELELRTATATENSGFPLCACALCAVRCKRRGPVGPGGWEKTNETDTTVNRQVKSWR